MRWRPGFEGDPSVVMMAGRQIPHPTPPEPIRPQVKAFLLHPKPWDTRKFCLWLHHPMQTKYSEVFLCLWVFTVGNLKCVMLCLCFVGVYTFFLLIVSDGGPGWRTVPWIWSVHGTVPGWWASKLLVPATWLCLQSQKAAAVGAWGRLGHRRECWPHLVLCLAITQSRLCADILNNGPAGHLLSTALGNKPLETFGGYQWGTEGKMKWPGPFFFKHYIKGWFCRLYVCLTSVTLQLVQCSPPF